MKRNNKLLLALAVAVACGTVQADTAGQYQTNSWMEEVFHERGHVRLRDITIPGLTIQLPTI